MVNAPFPPTPCQVVRCEWSDGYVSEYVGDSPRTSAEYVSSVYDAIAVPRAQWEAVEEYFAASNVFNALLTESAVRRVMRAERAHLNASIDSACERFQAAGKVIATLFPEAP